MSPAAAEVSPLLQRAAESSQAVLACARSIRTAFEKREPIDELMAEFGFLSAVDNQIKRDYQAAKQAGKAPPSEAGWRLALGMMQAAEQIQALMADVVAAAEKDLETPEGQKKGR